MKYSVVLLAAVIFLLSQCIHGAVYPFHTKQRNTAKHLFGTEYSNTFSTNDGFVDDGERVSPKRARRQTTGGSPRAYSYNLYDNREYALTLYSGEDSKVNVQFVKMYS